MARYDDLNTRQIWAVGIVSAALTVLTVLAVQVLYYALLDRHNDVKLSDSEYSQSNRYLTEQANELGRYGRHPETGAVQIPIDRAMRLIVERNAADSNAEQDIAEQDIAEQGNTEQGNTEQGNTEQGNSEQGSVEEESVEEDSVEEDSVEAVSSDTDPETQAGNDDDQA